MNAFDVDAEAMRTGGTVLAVPWGARQELRIAVLIDRKGSRRFVVRVWFRDRWGLWRPSRLGISGNVCGSELRRLGAALLAVGEAAPTLQSPLSARSTRRSRS